MVWSVLMGAFSAFSGQARAVGLSPPVAADDLLVITPLAYEAEVDVLDNDSDPAGDALQRPDIRVTVVQHRVAHALR